MSDPDLAFEKYKTLLIEFKSFCDSHGSVSEADTRVKLIDRVLKEVLNWQEPFITREDYTHGPKSGFSDYKLTIKESPYVVVEAKREGISFVLPELSGRRRLKISGILQSSKEVIEAVNQVRQYCVDDIIINYAIATNGYSWILFKATQKKGSWKDAYATVFYSSDDILSNFIDFWNLLSFDSIIKGSLEKHFALLTVSERQQERVRDKLINADLPLAKNRLHAQLHPVIDAFFLDIADKDQLEILQHCYVYSRSSSSASFDLDNVIKDAMPLFLKRQGTQNVLTGKKDSGVFDKELEKAIENNVGQLYLLLAGIGAGKTTFIKRYLKITGKSIMENDAVSFYISLLGPPSDPDKLEQVVFAKLLDEIRTDYSDKIQEKRRTLKKLYEKELSLLNEASFKAEHLSTDEYEKRISPYLEKWQGNIVDYVTRLLKECQRRGYAVIIIIDNVDQLPPEYQPKVFLLAQKVTREIGSITVLSLREESYYSASTQKILTAYANKKFHIASPRFRKLIEHRLNYAARTLMKSEDEIKYFLKSGIKLDRKAIVEFLSIIQKSIFAKSKQIPVFVEAICYGNMRLALDMFNTFLVSGATDVDKMLHIFNETGSYQVAFHEFLKSVMLEERMYYKETDGNPIMNVFECGADRNSSHFTGLRLLKLLEAHKDDPAIEGRGYVEFARIIYEFENQFDNVDALLKTANRLVRWRLIEVNTKSIESIEGASHARLTPAGSYYLHYLVHKFAYLDLVLQDTPLNDNATLMLLADYMRQVDNLTGRVEDKYARMKVRFQRVDAFLSYLKKEEEEEMSTLSTPLNPIFNHRFTADIIKRYDADKTWIVSRYVENMEKYQGVKMEEEPEEAEEAIEIPGLFDVYDADDNDQEGK